MIASYNHAGTDRDAGDSDSGCAMIVVLVSSGGASISGAHRAGSWSSGWR